MGVKPYGSQNGVDKPSRKPSKVGEGYDAPFRGYINVNLSAEQKAVFLGWADSQSVFEVLERSVSSGIGIAVKRDPKGTGFLASATQRAENSPNAGLVVTARASGSWLAVARCLFCIAVLDHAERWEDVQPLADPDRW